MAGYHSHTLIFLRPIPIAWYGMIAGVLVTGYTFFNCLRYYRYGDISPLFLGHVQMAFSTSIMGVIIGLFMFWTSWSQRRSLLRHYDAPLTSDQVVQISMTIISTAGLIIVALIALVKK